MSQPRPHHHHHHKDKKINDWTLKKEKLLRYWQEECKLYNWLYRQNVEWYQKINKYMSIFGILLSAITGTTLINQSNNKDEETDKKLFFAFGVISISSTFIQSVKEFMDFSSKISNNTLSSRQNSSIVIDIEEQLNLSRAERINGKDFMKHIKTRKNEIIQNGPMIPKSSWKKLRNSIRKKEGLNFFNQNLFQNYLDQNIDINRIDFNMDTHSSGSSGSENSYHVPVPSRPSFSTKTIDVSVQPTTINKDANVGFNTDKDIEMQGIDGVNTDTFTPEMPICVNNITNLDNTTIPNPNIPEQNIPIPNQTYTRLNKRSLDALNIELGSPHNNAFNSNNGYNTNNDFNDNMYNEVPRTRSNSVTTITGSEDEFLEDIKNNNMCMFELRSKMKEEEHSPSKLTNIHIPILSNFINKRKKRDSEAVLDGLVIDGKPIKRTSSKQEKKDRQKEKQMEKDEIKHMVKYRMSTL